MNATYNILTRLHNEYEVNDNNRKEVADVFQYLVFKLVKPDDMYRTEYFNHECGLDGNDEEALLVVNKVFPDYVPSEELKQECFDNTVC